jgi:hypothetical protein
VFLAAHNGSRDRSRELASAAGARVVEVKERGYGAALREAVAAARGQFIVMGDSDGTYDFARLEPFLARLRDGADLVMGNRFRGGIERGAMPWLHRFVGNPALTRLAHLFFGIRLGDVYCGLRAFRREAIERLALRSPGMEYALEMLVKAQLHGLRLAEVPTTLRAGADGRRSHLESWRDGRRSLRLYLLCAPRWLFLYPGLALAAAGVAVMALLADGSLRVAGVRLDVHTMVYASLAVLLGVQGIGFAFFSQILAERAGFVPERSATTRRLAAVRVEHALLAGAALVAVGLAGTIAAIVRWRATGFSDLDPLRMMRLVVPSATAIALGVQVGATGLYASVMKHTVPRREREPGAP